MTHYCLRYLFLLASVVIVLMACHVAHAGLCTLVEENSGCTLKLNPGDSLSVRLAGNLTTGYQWEIISYDKPVLRPIGEPDYAANSKAIGAGGMYTFRFEAVAPGTTCLKMIYHRTWEKGIAPLRAFQISLIVSKESAGCQTQNGPSDNE